MRASSGAEKSHSALRPEKPWLCDDGRGFDSRHLHHQCHVIDVGQEPAKAATGSSGAAFVMRGGRCVREAAQACPAVSPSIP